MSRALMTDWIQIYQASPVTSKYGEVTYDFSSATLVASGWGSLQLYFSAEYDIDRDTYQRIGRVITDDPALTPNPKHWIVANGDTANVYEADGKPQVWTLRGRHHVEFGIKKLEG